jgi:hypothetical protein
VNGATLSSASRLADIAVHLYMRERDGISLTCWKYFCAQKSRARTRLLLLQYNDL